MLIQRILGLAFIFLAAVGLLNLLNPELKNTVRKYKKINSKQHRQQGFQAPLEINVQWKRDIQKLIKEGEIPKAWTSIKEIRYIPLDEPLKKLVNRLDAPVLERPDGEFALEVTLMSHVGDDGKTYINFQHNIIDLENENTLWELNRLYPLIAEKNLSEKSKSNKK